MGSLTLSLRKGRGREGGGGGVVATSPSDFPSCRFCFSARFVIRRIFPPFVQIPMYLIYQLYIKILLPEQSWGEGCLLKLVLCLKMESGKLFLVYVVNSAVFLLKFIFVVIFSCFRSSLF